MSSKHTCSALADDGPNAHAQERGELLTIVYGVCLYVKCSDTVVSARWLCVLSLLCIPRRVSHMINQSINQSRLRYPYLSEKHMKCLLL